MVKHWPTDRALRRSPRARGSSLLRIEGYERRETGWAHLGMNRAPRMITELLSAFDDREGCS
jgi:hypothetical protein